MFRFFCKKRRLLSCVCVCTMLSFLIVLIFDVDEQERRFLPNLKLEVPPQSQNHSNIAFQRINISVKPPPLLSSKQRPDIHHLEKQAFVIVEKHNYGSISNIPEAGARNGSERKVLVNSTTQTEPPIKQSSERRKKSDGRQPAGKQQEPQKINLPPWKDQPHGPETGWKPPPNAGRFHLF